MDDGPRSLHRSRAVDDPLLHVVSIPVSQTACRSHVSQMDDDPHWHHRNHVADDLRLRVSRTTFSRTYVDGRALLVSARVRRDARHPRLRTSPPTCGRALRLPSVSDI